MLKRAGTREYHPNNACKTDDIQVVAKMDYSLLTTRRILLVVDVSDFSVQVGPGDLALQQGDFHS